MNKSLVIAALALLGLAVYLGVSKPTLLGSTNQLTASVITTTTKDVGPDVLTALFTANTACADRIISTVGSPIMLAFSVAASTTPAAGVGVSQGASTTVAYDAEVYGCGQVTAYAFASSTITIVETQ